jgi:hypothetical protein
MSSCISVLFKTADENEDIFIEVAVRFTALSYSFEAFLNKIVPRLRVNR